MRPRYSFEAINQLALSDTGHFVFLTSWTASLLDSILSQERALYLWANDQYPLSPSEIDDLDTKISEAQFNLMNSLVGLIMPVCSQSSPEGTLLCDGSIYNRVDYPNLYSVLDPALIVDPDTFMVPDLRDRFVLGASLSNVPTTTGGATTHTQTVSEMPSHAHSTVPHNHTEIIAVPTVVSVGLELPVPSATASGGLTGLADVTVNNSGGGEAMDIMPPFYALKYVVIAL